MKRDFLISVIIPVYNVEGYVAETIESVINQSLGLKNIEIILVNDGSTDGSAEICKKYKDSYGENIIYIEKENGGVSSARNVGIEHATGKYVTFLDSDDKWEVDSFKALVKFFDRHYDEIDVLSARVQFFEAQDTYHVLDYKFKDGSRIADLSDEKELFTIQTVIASNLIKREAIGDLRFSESLKYGEDSLFINKVILKKCKYGLCESAVYRYRRRKSDDSAVNRQVRDKSYYLDTIDNYHFELFDYSKKLYGEVIPYIQSVVAYDLLWRLANPIPFEVLNESEIEAFQKRVKELVNQIDDRILFSNSIHKTITKKCDVYRYKYGGDFLSELTLDDENRLVYGDIVVFKTAKNKSHCCDVVSAEIKKDVLHLEIFVARWLLQSTKEPPKFCIKSGKKLIEPSGEIYPHRIARTPEGNKPYYMLYRADIKLKKLQTGKTKKIKFCLVFGERVCPLSINYGKYVPNATKLSTVYSVINGYILRCRRISIQITKSENPARDRRRLKRDCIKKLIEKKEYSAALTRINLELYKRANKKRGEIWLVSDRIDNAGDNGEVFFKYLCEHKPEGVRPIFVIGEAASDEVKNRLKGIGEVILFEDKQYPSVFLSAKKIISSSAGEFTINPFGEEREYLSDLFNFKYYYLQHGVACADLSVWLNKYNKNISKIFTSGEKEYNAFLNFDYYYTEKNLALSGQARFDALYKDTKKQVLILPTWRRSIKASYDDKTQSVYFDGFKDTDYFKFYNSLINDERLLKVMREKGYTGLFCLHPIHKKQAPDFEANDIFSVNEGYIDYNKVFAESAVMVTDYSSVLFDFAYLRKPVVYTQFDKEEFFEGQIYDEGYFEYERDGFGKICYDLDSSVEELIRLIGNDCKNDEKYLKRLDEFFTYDDQNNSKRILEAILDENK